MLVISDTAEQEILERLRRCEESANATCNVSEQDKSQNTNNAYKVCARERVRIEGGNLEGDTKFLPCPNPHPHALPPPPTNPPKIDFLDFLGFLMYFWGNYGVLIIPKWLIKVPGHIAILVG